MGNDYGDVYDEELYDDIAAYDTEAALENLDLGWDLNSTSVLGPGQNHILNIWIMTPKWWLIIYGINPFSDALLLDDAVHPFTSHILFKKNAEPFRRKNNQKTKLNWNPSWNYGLDASGVLKWKWGVLTITQVIPLSIGPSTFDWNDHGRVHFSHFTHEKIKGRIGLNYMYWEFKGHHE